MSYTALYRKWRPATFDDVKGQDHIVTTLKNQMLHDRIGHAYLFCGTRGTGKTSVAKIFARAVNCEHPVDGSPCGECSTCRAVLEGRSLNVIEIDAASNNSVDNVRQIKEEVEYPPTEGKYKVYIIDEVHMLSTGAFNALLKTLEEPPSYVIFILATTEVNKLPITILSRCQRYDFRHISLDTISDRLAELMRAENISAEEKALRYVAKMADGSMRDALSLLDQCLAFNLGKELKYENVLDVLGAVDTEVFSQFFRGIVEGDTIGILKLLEKIIIDGRELSQFVADFIWYLRNLLLLSSDTGAEQIIDASAENMALMAEDAQMVDMNTLMRYIRVLSDLSSRLKASSQKRVLVEVALIKLMTPQMETNMDSILDRLRVVEKKISEGVFVQAQYGIPGQSGMMGQSGEFGQMVAGQMTSGNMGGEPAKALVKARTEDIENVARNWKGICSDIGLALGPLLNNYCRPANGGGNVLQIIAQTDIAQTALAKEENIEIIRQAVADKTGCDIEISVVRATEGQKIEEDYDLLDNICMPIETEDD